ncbi:hypothetical protein Tco_0701083 [Tanacetum coccineum]
MASRGEEGMKKKAVALGLVPAIRSGEKQPHMYRTSGDRQRVLSSDKKKKKLKHTDSNLIEAASATHPTTHVFINFASFRSVAASTKLALKQPTIWGERKGKEYEVFMVCIYEPHVSRKQNVVIRKAIKTDEQVECGVVYFHGYKCAEIPMGGRKFTRVSDDGMKFSMLGRFLLNDEFNNIWGNFSVLALDMKLLDHCAQLC